MFRKKIVLTTMMATFFSLIMLFAFQLPAYARQEVTLQVKGEAVTGAASVIVKNRIMIPIRDLADYLNADISWDSGKREVTVTHSDRQRSLVVGKNQAMVDGNSVSLDAAPAIVENKVLVPVRLIAEFCGYSVSWDKAAKVVSLDRQALVAGSSLDFPPFESVEGNEIVGFDIDLIEAIEELIGQEILIKDTAFDQLLPSLQAGEVDMIVSGLTITEERNKRFGFTNPYYDFGEVIVSAKATADTMTLEDLAGKRVACQAGSQSQELVISLQEQYPSTKVFTFETPEEVWGAVEKGKADAAIASHAYTAYYLNNQEDSNLRIVSDLLSTQPAGIVVRKGNQELLEKLNKCLETIKENGTYDRIYEKWFGKKI